jgi:hypothetical protein
MSDALIVAVLAGVAVIAAVLSFVAWHRLGRQPPEEESQLDADDPGI